MEAQAGTPAETKALGLASQESHRQMFRQRTVLLGETPLETLSRLSDAAHRWLRPQERTKEQIVDMIILEQFLSLLPEELQVCLRARGPASISISSKEIAQVVEAALQQREPAEVVAKLPVNFEEPSASLSESEQASVNPRQKTLYWKVIKESDESGSSSMGHSEIFTELNPSENTLRNSSVLFKHVASTARERCYACKDCGKSFAWKSTLKRHRMSHTANRPHKCHECGKSFQVRSTLVGHQKIHTGEKPHQCSHCGKSFRVKSALTQHQRLHTGEKPFQCPDCGKRFNERMKLVYHYRTHTGERPYQCFDCGKGFSIRSSLIRHNERVHP
ncbi:zinc finger and SCAN domain-containing protein 2-like [Zootoca vivipara]|uniref:zinc finger and SCAN domain-containing protein 2-like n=1 Tax=Zootoca vivipara TaxID=8524 RepID=UPI001591D1BB|nr:zinc finger and SCAN domain-containing protein 2-like [Zootoca vivipara]